jgi:uncharacterized protein with HEPN domain
MKRDDKVYLHHILDAINLIEEYTKGMSENEFLSNSMAHDAVVRQSKLLAKLPETFRMNFEKSIRSCHGKK